MQETQSNSRGPDSVWAGFFSCLPKFSAIISHPLRLTHFCITFRNFHLFLDFALGVWYNRRHFNTSFLHFGAEQQTLRKLHLIGRGHEKDLTSSFFHCIIGASNTAPNMSLSHWRWSALLLKNFFSFAQNRL